jgi:hypothetical protein
VVIWANASAEQASRSSLAVLKEQSHESAHVGRRRGDRAVGCPGLQPRGRGERRAGISDPVVVEILVADGESGMDVVRDRGLRGGHSERFEDAGTEEVGVRSTLDGFQHESKCLVAHVGVVEALARRGRRGQVAEGPDLESRLRSPVDAGRDAGGVRQEMSDRDRGIACGRRHREPRQVPIHGRLKIDLPLVDELEDEDRRKRFADGADLEQRFRRNRLLGSYIGEAVGPDGERFVAIRHAKCQSRLPSSSSARGAASIAATTASGIT